jgi:uncharacterized protein (TIGR03118 family)
MFTITSCKTVLMRVGSQPQEVRQMKSIEPSLYRIFLVVAAMILIAASAQRAAADGANGFTQTNLVSDIPGMAATTDPNLVNPWGMSSGATSPIWVSDNGAGVATLYTGAGGIVPLVVTIPPAGSAAPTGQVFNPNPGDFGGAHFIFATEGGTIAAWSGGTSAILPVDDSAAGAVYKGLTLGSSGGASYLYATDFHNGAISVFDTNFNKVNLGSFTDPTLPAGYAPFNIQNIGGKLYVTYAVQDAAKHDDVSGPGNGIVDEFDTNGNFIQRLISGGALNSPWGMAPAPGKFGSFGGDLLIGNFGDGMINAFDPTTGMWMGQLDGANGMPLINMGLWGLQFGNGGSGGKLDQLFFTAGIPGHGMVEDHGLFGSIVATPEPGTFTLIGSGLLGLIAYRRRRTDSTA